MKNTLRVHEIYRSIQGESTWAGLPCIFIRLTGCPLRCSYCDTAYAFRGGETMTLEAILEKVAELADGGGEWTATDASSSRLPLIELTGGEPLAQAAAVPLMQALVDTGFTVLIETSGSMDTGDVPPAVRVILDIKCPSSGEAEKCLVSNIRRLRPTDEVKFVVATREDLEFMEKSIREHDLSARCQVLVSWASPLMDSQFDPSLKRVPESMNPVSRREVVDFLLDRRIPARFQLQMHKFIWPPDQKGV